MTDDTDEPPHFPVPRTRRSWLRALREQLTVRRQDAIEDLRVEEADPPRPRSPLYLTDPLFGAITEAHLLGCEVWPANRFDDLRHVRVAGRAFEYDGSKANEAVRKWARDNCRGRYYPDFRRLYLGALRRHGGLVGARLEYWAGPRFIPLFLEDDADFALARVSWE